MTLDIRRSIVLLAFAATVAAHDAAAAIKTGPDGQPMMAPDGSPVIETKLESACQASLQRFCPELAGLPGQTRSEIICLRPYRSSLPLGCRSLVSAKAKPQ